MHEHNHSDHVHHHHDVPATGASEDLAICPVQHIPVNKKDAEASGRKRTVNGKDYYLCCNTCAEEFDSNPARYTK